MANNKSSKIDLLFCFLFLLAIHIALRISSRLEIENPPESNSHNRSEENGETFSRGDLPTRNEDLGLAGNGQGGHDSQDGDDFRPRFPFFFWESWAIPIISTVDVVEEELRAIARQAAESPSIASKHDREENDLVLLAATKKIEGDQSQVLRLRGGAIGGKKMSDVTGCGCGGACNHIVEDYCTDDYDVEIEEDWIHEVQEAASITLNGSFDEDRRDAVDDFPPPVCNIDNTKKKAKKTGKHVVKKKTTAKRLKVYNTMKKKNSKVNYANIEKEEKSYKCCSRKCIQKTLSIAEIYETRKMFLEKSQEQQRAYLLNFFQISQRSKNGRTVYAHYINRKEVCQKAWIFSHGMAHGRYHNWKREVETRGATQSHHGRTGMVYKSKRRIEAEIWFEEFVSTFANVMPDINKRELPSCMTVSQIYKMYRDATKRKPLSLVQFRRMWKQSFRNVILPKTNRFSKCGVCVLITEHIRSTRNKEERLTWTERKQWHMDQQANERKKYYKHQKKAVQNPQKYMSVIIDGMDQAKTHLPHWVQSSKLEGDNAHFLKTHVTGTLSHGDGIALCFLDLMRWPQDANPTTNALISTFRHVISKRGSLPPILYLQLDNCYRDCKNIHILGFCALLVKAGVFKKVRLSYLVVGHTHEDIDQMFSRIAQALRKVDAVTIDQLRRVISSSYTPSPDVYYRENIYDIKSWLRPYSATLKHHSNPHAFRFTLNENGEVEMSYRNWATADKKEWLPEEGPFIVLRELPPGTPSILKPDNVKCPTEESMENNLRHVQKRMTPQELAWWNEFVNREKKRREQWQAMTPEDYRDAGRNFDLLQMKYVNPPSRDDDKDEAHKKRERDLRDLLEKKNRFPPVQITKNAIGGKDKEQGKKRKRDEKKREMKPQKKAKK